MTSSDIWIIYSIVFFISTVKSARPLMLCDKFPIATYGNRYKLQFYDNKVNEETILFKEGADYYIIGR